MQQWKQWVLAAVMLPGVIGLLSPVTLAETDWYDMAPEAYQLTPPPNPAGLNQPTPYAAPPGLDSRPTTSQAKPKWWQFWKPKPAPPPKEEQLVEVGPRNYPAVPDPLLRLATPLWLGKGQIVTPGIYRVKALGMPIPNDKGVTPAAYTNEAPRLQLWRQATLVLDLPLVALAGPAVDGPVEPIVSKKKGEAPPPIYQAIQILPDANGKTVQLQLQYGQRFYQTQAIPRALP